MGLSEFIEIFLKALAEDAPFALVLIAVLWFIVRLNKYFIKKFESILDKAMETNKKTSEALVNQQLDTINMLNQTISNLSSKKPKP